MHLTSLVLPTLCLGVAIGLTTAQTCDNGLAGVSNGDICCTLGCGTCGGPGCSTRVGFTGDDCCTANVVANGILCADSGAAPCIGDVDDDVPTEPETETETETEITGSSYVGCFSDVPEARIFTFGASAAAMTADACLAICADSAYYGTQYSEECWCGAEGADYDANGEGVCEMPCGGDVDEICGGSYAMSVYEIDVDDGVIDDPSYLGCYSDPADNRVFVQGNSSASMTAEVCSEACADSAYYGTQFSTECWCGAEGADYDANGAGVCDMSCGGDVAEICGGSYAMSVYENDVDDGETEDPSYLGCYSDPADSRVFVQDISSDAMTAEICSEACAGSAYYGTQFSTECWCGAEGADYDANGAGVCDMSCGGDVAEICGGSYAMSVYENDVDDGETEDPSYLGCYSDPADSRVFVQDISSDAMTAEICSEACAGSAYYGTQFSTECWCGAEGADYDANGAGVCDMSCGGDVDEICGGSYAMSVYESADDGEPDEFSCSGDAGVSSGSSCCEADCVTCGGAGCSSRGSGAASCCTVNIQSAGILCSDSGAAPCIL